MVSGSVRRSAVSCSRRAGRGGVGCRRACHFGMPLRKRKVMRVRCSDVIRQRRRGMKKKGWTVKRQAHVRTRPVSSQRTARQQRGRKEGRKKSRRRNEISHLLLYVFERVRGVDGEAEEEDVRVGVGQRAEAIRDRSLSWPAVSHKASSIGLCRRPRRPRRSSRRPWGRGSGAARREWVSTGLELDETAAHLWERVLAEDDEKTGLWTSSSSSSFGLWVPVVEVRDGRDCS